MFDGLVEFFRHFEEKDWVNFSIATLAALGAIYQAIRGHLNHEQTLLKDQARFELSWVSPNNIGSQNWGLLVLRNAGTADAYDVTVMMSGDPGRLLGFRDNAAGPVRPGQAMRTVMNHNVRMLGTEHDPAGLKDPHIFVEWTDQFGVRRRQVTRHDRLTHEFTDGDLQSAYGVLPKDVTAYTGGEIGTTTFYDPRLSFRGIGWRPRSKR
jgi:hypothetical protein